VFVPLFPELFDIPLFPTIFLICSRVPIVKFPVFPCPPKTPGGPSQVNAVKRSPRQLGKKIPRKFSLVPYLCGLNFMK